MSRERHDPADLLGSSERDDPADFAALAHTAHMPTGDASEAPSAAIAALTAEVDGMRAEVRGMHAELRHYPAKTDAYRSAVPGIAAATTELIDAQRSLGEMWLAHRRRLVEEQVERDQRRTRRQLWLVTEGVGLVGLLIVVLAASGAIPTSRVAIGLPVLVASALMSASMRPRTVRDAGPHALDIRKGVATASLAVLSLIGAVLWPILGYACVLALAIAAVPVLAALQTGQRRAAERDVRRV